MSEEKEALFDISPEGEISNAHSTSRYGRDVEQRARKAETILKNSLVKEAFATIEKQIFNEWSSAKTKEELEDLWRFNKAFQKLKGYFEQIVTTGKLSATLKEQELDEDLINKQKE